MDSKLVIIIVSVSLFIGAFIGYIVSNSNKNIRKENDEEIKLLSKEAQDLGKGFK